MGKATILTCDQGAASIQYDLLDYAIVRRIAKIDATLLVIAQRKMDVDAQISDTEDLIAGYVSTVDGQVADYAACVTNHGPRPPKDQKPSPPPWPCDGMEAVITENQKNIAETSARLYVLKQIRHDLDAQQAQLEASRINYQSELNTDLEMMDVWVADWTEETENPAPASVTGTIEVWGMRYASDTCRVPRKKVIVVPQYDATDRAYRATPDFQVTGPMGSEASRVFDMLATWCWVQEHRPRYITAVVLSVDHAARTITVRRSVPVGLEAITGVDYTWEATLPAIYRDCGTLAFKTGDRVVVEFSKAGKQQGTVIGFEDHPRGCKFEGWIIGPQTAGRATVIRDSITGEWTAGPVVAGGTTSWWHNNGEVVSWLGSPRRYWGVPAESRTLYLRGVSYAIPTSRGYVRGACVRKIGGVRYLYVISADRSARKDYLFRLAIPTETTFTELSAWSWEADEISATTNTYSTHIFDGWQKQAHVVAFNPAGTAAVTIRGYGAADARMIQYAIGETSGTRTAYSLPHNRRDYISEGSAGITDFASIYLNADKTIALDYGPSGALVELRYTERAYFVWENGGTWSLSDRNALVCGASEIVFTDESITAMPYNQGLERTQTELQLDQVDLRLENPFITYAIYQEDEPPYGTTVGLGTPYNGPTRETRVIQGLADDDAESTKQWTSVFWAPSFVAIGDRLDINLEGRTDWTVADAATGPQGNYIVNAMTSSHLAALTSVTPVEFAGTCSNVSMSEIALLTGRPSPFQNYGFIAY